MARPKTPASEYEPVTLRIPPDLLAQVRAFVAETGVPLNTAMIQFLRHGVDTKKKPRQHRALATVS
jgi:hypothetical protein